MRIRILTLCLTLPLIGAEPAGYKHWAPAELKERTKALSPKIDAHKIATERLANFGNYHALQLIIHHSSGMADGRTGGECWFFTA